MRRLPAARDLRIADPVVRLIVVNWALGAILGVVMAGAILLLDVADLRTLLERSDSEWAGALLLFAGFAITFGGVVSASAAMFCPGPNRD
jgi:hypothetical protein